MTESAASAIAGYAVGICRDFDGFWLFEVWFHKSIREKNLFNDKRFEVPKCKNSGIFVLMRNNAGNVLFYILIAVGLLSALSYVVAQSSRGSASGMTKEKASLEATQLLEFSNILGNAAAQLRLRGCAESELSFDNAVDSSTYDNSSAPADESCHIFSLKGAGVQYNSSIDALYTGSYVITDVGTAQPDLVVDVVVDKLVCEAVNARLDIENNGSEGPPSDELSGGAAFDGTYSAVAGAPGRIDDAGLVGKSAGCRTDSGSGSEAVFKFYKVLLAR